MIFRLLALLAALSVSAAAFLLMAWLIKPKGEFDLESSDRIAIYAFEQTLTEISPDEPPPEPELVEPPPPVAPIKPVEMAQPNTAVVLDMPELQTLDVADLQLSLPELRQQQIETPKVVIAQTREARVVAEGSSRYPPLAKRRKIEGYVTLEFNLNEQGRAEAIKVVAAEPEGMFEEAAIRQVETSIFQSELVDGQKTPINYTRTIRFKL